MSRSDDARLDRRAVLRGAGRLGAAMGAAGGLLLPWRGGGAWALPDDLGPAAQLRVTRTALPVSAELLEIRRLNQELFAWECESKGRFTRDEEAVNYTGRYREITRLADKLCERPIASWSQCAELAEVAWFFAKKEEVYTPDGYWRGYSGKLLMSDPWRYQGLGHKQKQDLPYHQPTRVNACLFEAVLTLAGGRRIDHRIDYWRARLREESFDV